MEKNPELTNKEITNKLREQQLFSTSSEFRIIALTHLLMKKGIITENEVQESYKEVIKSVKKNSKFNKDLADNFEEYLKGFFQVD